MSARPYTEADIRRDPSLLGIAVAYALTYFGDFHVVVSARRAAERNGTLTVPVARTVLNIARTDPAVSDRLPAPAEARLGFAFREVEPAVAPLVKQEPLVTPHAAIVPPTSVVMLAARARHPFVWTTALGSEDSSMPQRYHYTGNGTSYHSALGVTYVMHTLCRHRFPKRCKLGKEPPSTYELCRACANTIRREVREHELHR